jgi:cell division cycle protein 37
MSTKPFDYSKWDNIELSDDEDTHPGAQFIETQTLRRLKREAHEHKESERKAKVDALGEEKKRVKKEIRALEESLVALVEGLSVGGEGRSFSQRRRGDVGRDDE